VSFLKTKIKSFCKTLAKIITLILVTLVFLEIGLGLMFALKDTSAQLIHLSEVQDFPYLYYRLKHHERDNADGLPTQYSRKKSEGAYRVILIGGSTAAWQSAEVLEAQLEKRLSLDVELINGATEGYGVEQEFLSVQILLQKYEPDLIVSLNGYNDFQSIRLNHFEMSHLVIPPQNEKEFHVIQFGKDQKSSFSRLRFLFKNCHRGWKFAEALVRGKNQYDFTDLLNESRQKDFAELFSSIIKDTYDFCAAKGIRYLSIMQPVRWYQPPALSNEDSATSLVREKGEIAFAKLYHSMESKALKFTFARSVTPIMNDHLDTFLDDCHFNENGKAILSEALAKVIAEEIRSNKSHVK